MPKLTPAYLMEQQQVLVDDWTVKLRAARERGDVLAEEEALYCLNLSKDQVAKVALEHGMEIANG